MSEKIKVSQWVVNILISLTLAAYAWIFNSVCQQVADVQAYTEKIEKRIDAVNPSLLQIQTDLAEIKTNILWLKEKIK